MNKAKRRVCGNCGSPDHLFANCPTNRCNRCHKTGHIAIYCPRNTIQRTICRTCKSPDHLYKECPYNHCYGCNEQGHIEIDCPLTFIKRQNQLLHCGCQSEEIEACRMCYYSSRRTHHCCKCKVPIKPEDLRLLEDKLSCQGCYSDFCYELDREDPRSIHYYTQGEGRGLLVNCKLCKKSEPKSRMYQLESSQEELWFCELEHLYAYKASQDILYNPNYNLWTRIQHYTESTRSAGHQYNMNQTRIFRLAKVLLQESDLTIVEALEPRATDRIHSPWTPEQISLILRAEQSVLNEGEEDLLQQAIEESFDTSHPEFNKQVALANMRRSFTILVDLCKECSHVKHQEELDENDGYCTDCAPPPLPIYESEILEIIELELDTITPITSQLQQQINQQNQLIEQLQTKVLNLENFNQQLVQLLRVEAQQTQNRLDTLNTILGSSNF